MKKLQPLIYALLISSGILIGSIGNNNPVANEGGKINAILNLIDNHYVDTLNTADFEDKTINAILNELDPHSAYIPVKDYQNVEEDMQGSFSGIGVQFNIIDDSIVVVSAISGGPSEKLGIQSGDRIISVEKEDVASTGIKNEGVIKLLRGEKGTTVNIIIKRRGQQELMPFAIVRDDIPLYSVDVGIMLQDQIGYIKINRFAATTYTEMMEKVSSLQQKGMQKLILDFRGNPGGYLHIANQICDEFLKEGELIVFTEGRNRSKEETFATRNGQLEKMKVIALIDEGSASASEIVSGALQDNDRGLVIGRRSFGKGLVQEQIPMQDGSVIRLTTQRYYTPSGRCIQKDYGENEKYYYLEQYTRKVTTSQPDSLTYTTKNGRTVYGGGGITPDIIIKRDSAVNYLQINRMISKGWLNEFCLKQSEQLKKKNIKSHTEIDKAIIYSQYQAFVITKDSDFKLKLGNTELKYFSNLLKATTCRNIWDNDVYFSILSAEDEYIQRAISEF
ncbi:MAG: S41 family peptidase [Flavobacteriales bacterium]|nr:S41 family peptidase [Flavobacteriales bacterium]